MKTVKIAILMLMAVVFVLPSCKKGENDPFLSLSSRKARLTGTWSLKEGTINYVSGGTTYTYTYNGTQCTLAYGSFSSTTPYTQKITVNKDGSYAVDVNDDSDLSTEEGQWYFGGKSKELDLKNKESVVMRETSYTYTPSGGSASVNTYEGTSCPISTMNIDKLASKEMVVIYDGSDTGSSTTTITGTMTYEQ
jgi:hypothetical protein